MHFTEKLAYLRTVVDQVRHRYRRVNGIYEVEVQAGTPPTPFPRWGGEHREICKAYDIALDDALHYWTCKETNDMIEIPEYQREREWE